jgi:hypothetical protein
MERFSLKDKVAIVTGASRGIGEAIAIAYAEAGARLVLSSRRMENVGPVAEKINAAGGRAIAVAAHAGHPDEVAKLVARAKDEFGKVDIAVNNAGTSIHFGPVVTANEAEWDKTFQTNLKGYFFLCKEVVPVMREQGYGKIINVASGAGMVPFPGMGVYGSIRRRSSCSPSTWPSRRVPTEPVNAIALHSEDAADGHAWQISSAVGGRHRGTDGSRRRRCGASARPKTLSGGALPRVAGGDFTSGAVLVADGATQSAPAWRTCRGRWRSSTKSTA